MTQFSLFFIVTFHLEEQKVPKSENVCSRVLPKPFFFSFFFLNKPSLKPRPFAFDKRKEYICVHLSDRKEPVRQGCSQIKEFRTLFLVLQGVVTWDFLSKW